jgi:acetyl esterase/lipase
MVARWCTRLKARALMIDYRLAPEHLFPAAADNCHAAYQWLIREGYDPRHIVVAGDSAGGNLALVTLQRIQQAAEPSPMCGIMLSAGVNFSLSSRSMVANADSDSMFDLAELVAMRGFYASPDCHGRPAACQQGRCDRLLPRGQRVRCGTARAAPTKLDVIAGLQAQGVAFIRIQV